MSRALTIADKIAERLNGWAGLQNVAAIVDRQKDILSQVATNMQKSKGACVTVLYEGFRNRDENSGGPLVIYRYTIRCYGLAIIQQGNPDHVFIDDIQEAVAKALHNWVPQENMHNYGECKVKSGEMEPHNNFLIYALDVEVWAQM